MREVCICALNNNFKKFFFYSQGVILNLGTVHNSKFGDRVVQQSSCACFPVWRALGYTSMGIVALLLFGWLMVEIWI